MENKAKFFIIGLVGALAACFFLFMQTLNSKQIILRERDDLKEKNASLNSQVAKIETSLRDYENKIDLLNRGMDKLSREKQDLERRYELAGKEKQNLIERLKTMQIEMPAAPHAQLAPSTTDAYWAEVLKAKTDLEMQFGGVRSELKSIQINNEQLQREKNTVELDLNNLKHENEDLKRQIEYNQKLTDTITQQLVSEKNDKIKIQNSLKAIRNENRLLTRQLKSLNNRRADLETKLQEFQKEKSAIENKFNGMQAMLAEKISQISELKEELDAIRSGEANLETIPRKKEFVELPPIVVHSQSERKAEQDDESVKLTGKILAVNKESNFAIIDLGMDSGINVGDAFRVYRQGEPIADIEVIQARKSIAACDIRKETTPIKAGDIIR
jgi:predicted nuclease with TOPRIM domain